MHKESHINRYLTEKFALADYMAGELHDTWVFDTIASNWSASALMQRVTEDRLKSCLHSVCNDYTDQTTTRLNVAGTKPVILKLGVGSGLLWPTNSVHWACFFLPLWRPLCLHSATTVTIEQPWECLCLHSASSDLLCLYSNFVVQWRHRGRAAADTWLSGHLGDQWASR